VPSNHRILALSAIVALCATPAFAVHLCVAKSGPTPAGYAPCSKTISAAVAAASIGDVIDIAPGIYAEDVVIHKSISLVGNPTSHPVINAAGLNNGIFVDGTATAPLPGIANVVIQGLEIHSANYEGILVANGTNISLADNIVHNNNKALTPTACPGIPAFETNEVADCGEGVHFIAVDHSSIVKSLIYDNSGGILITDESGPSFSNLVQGNIVHDNGYACGITMAGHPPATSLIPSAQLSFGIMHNTIAGNESYKNGLLLPGAGAGVGIFAPFPGTVNTANVVTGNDLHDNGLPGVTMHNHAYAPAPAPGINLNDNVIVGNKIYGNAADTEDAFTKGPTGIDLYSVGPVTGTVISGNTFSDEAFDIVFNAPGSLEAHFNNFNDQTVAIANQQSGAVNATLNYYACTGAKCPTNTGVNVVTLPHLTTPY
jgi:nitrous oxidase accessory protein NosD